MGSTQEIKPVIQDPFRQAFDRLLHSPATRRRFLQKSAVVAGALGLGGVATLVVGCDEDNSALKLSPSGSFPSPSPHAPETIRTKEGVLPLGDWQFEIQGWGEQGYEPNPSTPEYFQSDRRDREGWKYVIIRGKVRNVGNKLSTPPDLKTLYFLSDDGDLYETANASSGIIHVPNSYLASPGFPPGFSKKAERGGWIPEIVKDYWILTGTTSPDSIAENQNPTALSQNRIRKGEVVGNSPIISPETRISDISTPLIVPNWGTVTFKNGFVSKEGSLDLSTGKTNTDWYAQIQIANTIGQDIDPFPINLLIILRNGNYLVSLVTSYESVLIPPGLSKNADFSLAGLTTDLDNFTENIKGAIFTVIYKDTDWIAWQLS